uniref:Putative non-baculovirus protein e-4 n=1 Tax=Malacosoma sp. alphabaculovirus TaxID=1881632 RepID=A0A1B1V5J9_9ABAC|nr:putative non-baculovirus protein e-4 [Malacosoma sp. alphabaculovirus]
MMHINASAFVNNCTHSPLHLVHIICNMDIFSLLFNYANTSFESRDDKYRNDKYRNDKYRNDKYRNDGSGSAWAPGECANHYGLTCTNTRCSYYRAQAVEKWFSKKDDKKNKK